MGEAAKYRPSLDLEVANNSQTMLALGTGEGKTVLEVGPASGYITEVLKDRGCTVTCIEVDPDAAQSAAAFAERMIMGDIEKLDLAAEFADERFDVIMFGDVLEHLVDPARILRAVRSLLAPDGYVIASIPNVAHASIRLSLLGGDFRYTEVGLLDRTHLKFFTYSSAQALFVDAGYAIDQIERVIADPFGTEQDVREGDYPPELIAPLREDIEAMTYQFVMRATPVAEPSEALDADERPARAVAQSLWELHDKATELYEIIVQKDEDIVELQRMTAEKDQHIRNLIQAVEHREQAISALNTELTRVRKFSAARLGDALRRLGRKGKDHSQ